jgi:imidazolonepropionase-like amidohydrolase
MVDEAARAKRVVAAHCHGKGGIMNALNAGVRTIEHGSYLDEECAALMKEKGAILVATRLVVEGGLVEKNNWPPVNYKKLVAIANAHKKAYTLAVKSGVKIALGTDQSSSDLRSTNAHGRNGKEFVYAVEAGLSELQAIEACTAMGPETLGEHMGPKSGILKEGYDADWIALDENPLEDIGVLSEAVNVKWVWKGGKLFKSP